MAGKDVAVDLVEGAICAGTIEPAEVRRIIIVEGARPWRKTATKIGGDRCCRLGIPARPRRTIERQPGAPTIGERHQPVQIARSNRAVKATGISKDGGTHGIPIRAIAYRIGNRCEQTRLRGQSHFTVSHLFAP